MYGWVSSMLIFLIERPNVDLMNVIPLRRPRMLFRIERDLWLRSFHPFPSQNSTQQDPNSSTQTPSPPPPSLPLIPSHFFLITTFLSPSLFKSLSFFPFFPPASISRCPAFSARFLSVKAVRPEECFLVSLRLATTLAFLGAITREPRFAKAVGVGL
jgi:hypothetical protein